MVSIRWLALVCVIPWGSGGALAQDSAPGTSITIDAANLPPPRATPSAHNPPEVVPRPDGAGLTVPPGFGATEFARGLAHPRNLTVAPNGDVLVAEQAPGKITLLREAGHGGVAGPALTFAEGLDQPFGLVAREGALYVADLRGVWRYDYRPGDTRATGAPKAVTPPGALGPGGGHVTRAFAFAPDGRTFYVAIGSAANLEEEDAPRATIQEFSADGKPLGTFASGLRNPVGIAVRPGSDDLYAVVNERDGLGDGLVPDYLTRVTRGGFYGWPYAYLGGHPQPGELGRRHPDKVARTLMPDVLFQSHSAPLGLVFYTGSLFPAEYRGDAFVAFHGSWNSSKPTGYLVARVPFRDGRPRGGYQIFATGFRLPGDSTQAQAQARVWGRPVGLAVAPDGALLIADDTGGSVWRITHQPP